MNTGVRIDLNPDFLSIYTVEGCREYLIRQKILAPSDAWLGRLLQLKSL